MLPEVVWSLPPMGTINVHGSLLPQYRGAAPINWAVMNGEKETGVTTFKLQHEIDTGNILLQEKITIGEDETAGDVHDKMKMVGAELLVKTIKGLAHGLLKETPQSALKNGEHSIGTTALEQANTSSTANHTTLRHAPKIFTETCHIDWTKSVDEVYNLIRGLSPFPGAFTELDGKTLKIYKSEKEHITPKSAPGKHETDGKNYLKFAATDGYITVKELQLEGKKRMNVEDFLRGYRG